MKQPPAEPDAIKRLRMVARDLRDPDGGCPWDLQQDHKSLRKDLIEEAYEVADAIDDLNPESGTHKAQFTALKEELGDLLFQIVIHCQLAEERGSFTLDDVANSAADKLIGRHPHVYGNIQAASGEQVLRNWEQSKRTEKAHRGQETGIFSGLPRSMPPLQKAWKIGVKSSRLGFDWPADQSGYKAILAKVCEEWQELQEELPQERSTAMQSSEVRARIRHEAGDLIFALVQLCRHLDMDADEVAQSANSRFLRRFRIAESRLTDILNSGRIPDADAWEAAWQQAKKETD